MIEPKNASDSNVQSEIEIHLFKDFAGISAIKW